MIDAGGSQKATTSLAGAPLSEHSVMHQFVLWQVSMEPGAVQYDRYRLTQELAFAPSRGLPGETLVNRGTDRYGRRLARGARRAVPSLVEPGRSGDGERSAVGRAVLRAVLRPGAAGPAADRPHAVAHVASTASRNAARVAAIGAASRGAGEVARSSRHGPPRCGCAGGYAARIAVHDDAGARPVHVGIDGSAPTPVTS